MRGRLSFAWRCFVITVYAIVAPIAALVDYFRYEYLDDLDDVWSTGRDDNST